MVLVATPVWAQGRGGGRYGGQDVPPGHYPPPGECRVWYDGVPPGRQPPPTSCREAERVAARASYARVIYGDSRDGARGRDDNRRGRGRAIPRRNPYPGDYPYPNRYPYPESRYPYPGRYPNERGGSGYDDVPFDSGYRDGFEKGREDARDRDSYDPVRHSRYRSADRGYDRRFGSREEYKVVYREGFEAGYDEGYREHAYAGERGGGFRLPWPF
jgi:hypothetical protein